jgi:hypothetical protein
VGWVMVWCGSWCPVSTLRFAFLGALLSGNRCPCLSSGAYKIRSFVEESKLKKKGKTISFRTKTEEERAIALGYDTGPGPGKSRAPAVSVTGARSRSRCFHVCRPAACVALPSFTELPYGKSKSMALRLQSNEIGVSWVPGPGVHRVLLPTVHYHPLPSIRVSTHRHR